jgi:hypothetical protein
MIHIGVEEWLVRIRLDAWDDEAFGSNPACKLDRRARSPARCPGRIRIDKCIDDSLADRVLRAVCDKWSLKRPSRLR